MKTLAVDTSSNILSLALLDQGQLLLEWNSNLSKQHGESLIPMVEQVLQAAKWQATDIECLAVGRGPGSYTGLRIGITFAKIWASSCPIPLETFSSLELMAASVNAQETSAWIIPVIDARRLSAYTAAYQWKGYQLTNRLTDGHYDWRSWLSQSLLPQLKAESIQTVYVVIEERGELTDLLAECLAEEEVLLHIIEGSNAWAKAANLPKVSTQLVKDVDLLEPFYAHLSLAEQEWIAKREAQLVDIKQTYVEQSNEILD